jgi:hypothetical protein
MRTWPGGIGGIATERVVGSWASAFTATNRTSAAAANDNSRGKIFRLVDMLTVHFLDLHECAFSRKFLRALLLQTSSMPVELCRSAERAISI